MKQLVFATGSRKRAVARLRLKFNGTGRVYINGKRPLEYFKLESLVLHALEPLAITKRESKYDLVAKVKGGGISGQAGAVRHALAKALAMAEPELRDLLKKNKMLSRDPREKERMKYGLSKRRKAPQYSKR